MSRVRKKRSACDRHKADPRRQGSARDVNDGIPASAINTQLSVVDVDTRATGTFNDVIKSGDKCHDEPDYGAAVYVQ